MSRSLLLQTKGRQRNIEKLWQKFFSDPSQWWDHRVEKDNPRYPDFKHKKTQEALWLDGKMNPPWVEAEVAAMASGTLQVDLFTWTKRLARHVKEGQFEKSIKLFQQMQGEGMTPDKFTFVPVLNACSSLQDLQFGRQVHAQIIRCGCDSDIYVCNCLIDMYAKCGNAEEALKVFTTMPTRDVVSWNAMISGYVKCGQGQKSLKLFQQMQQEGVEPSCVTFMGLLNACASVVALDDGRCVHEQIIQSGCECDLFVGSSLIDMYAKCGSIQDARGVFNRMSTHSMVSWSAMILGYVKCGQGQQALELFEQMQQDGVEPGSATFVAVLNACASVGALERGHSVHQQIIQRGFESDVFVSNSLVDMYSKCGSIENALGVFNKMPTCDVVSWNAMILGCARTGKGQKALELFQQMQEDRVDPDPVTFLGVLNACASMLALEEGRTVHGQIIQRGFESDVFVGNSLLDMYFKCGSTEEAWRVFEKLSTRDIVSWNAMILGYVRNGEGEKALELYQQMKHDAVDPNSLTFVGLLNACGSLAALEEGRSVHGDVILRGFESDVFVGSSLVNMYSKCGTIEDAWRVFEKMSTRDVVAWSAMILGYVKSGEGQKALDLYQQMQGEDVNPDPATFVGVLNACGSVGALEEGRSAHVLVIQRGFESDAFVGSALVGMYSKCGNMEDAKRVFAKMPTRGVVSWNSMILGYTRCGEGQRGLELFQQMQSEGVDPDPASFVAVLNACASVAALEDGRIVHEQIIERGLQSYVVLGNSLIDMYSKCGSLEDAWNVFAKMPIHDNVSWTSMLGGYAMHGQVNGAVGLFESMCAEGVEMNGRTFVSLLSGCSHGGLVDEGLFYFELMSSVHGYTPAVDQYACLIDLLGRAGRLNEAEDLIKSMSCKPGSVVWMALLGACRLHGNLEMAERASKALTELDSGGTAGYILLSNIYVATGKEETCTNIQQR